MIFLQVGSSWKPPNSSNNNNSLGMSLQRSSNNILPPPTDASPLIFSKIVVCWSSISSFGAVERKIQVEQIKNLTKLTLFMKINLFFLNKYSWDFCKTLLISKVLEKLIQTMFANFLMAFIKKRTFEIPSSIICSNVSFCLHL